MSLCIGFVDHEDGVLAADGRMLRKGSVRSESVLKTMRLNDSLAIAFVGRIGEIRQVQGALIPGYEWKDSTQFCQAWEDSGRVLNIGFKTARDRVKKVVQSIRRRPSEHDDPGIGVLLMGKARGRPVLWGWDNAEGSKPTEDTWGFMSIGARPEDGSDELERYGRIIAASQTAKGAERRLAEAIRYCASDLGHHAVNGNVSTRRLSKRNALVWDCS